MSAIDPLPTPRQPSGLTAHPDAELVPLMPESEYAAFRTDIDERGVLVPIEINPCGAVLDGRQRLRAARELDLETVPIRVIVVEDEHDYMLRAAVLRRQLKEAQRAALALSLATYQALREDGTKRQRANLRQHSPEVASSPPRGKSREIAACWAGVSPRTIQDVATVREHNPELFDNSSRAPLRRRQRRAASAASSATSNSRRHDRCRKPFELIYADPPWQTGNPDGPHAPENHYPCMPLEEIKALALPAADDSLLLLWAVASLLPEALEVLGAWGFTYKSNLIWDKSSIGPGVWLRNQHEQLLLATRGSWSPPDPEDRIPSLIQAPRGRHSQKPPVLYELIERMYPQARKLELFARTARPGWTSWGKEAPQ